MKWQGRLKIDNLEDRRGVSSSSKTIGGGIVILLLNVFGG